MHVTCAFGWSVVRLNLEMHCGIEYADVRTAFACLDGCVSGVEIRVFTRFWTVVSLF